VEIPVVLHERVEDGQVLAQIDREPFELAVRSARAALANAGQQVGAQTAGVDSAAGRLGVSRARLERSQRNYDRVQRVSERNPGALSEADRDRAEASLEQAQAQLISSKAELERAKQTLGSEGPDNPMIESAAAALETAQFNLTQTTVTAASTGLIESLQLDVGHYAQAGQPLMTFVSIKDAWIQADMRENNLYHLKPGDPVELVLDVAPGRVFQGTIRSVGVGVSSSQSGSRGDLPTVESVQGWLRDPQRFPVIISFADDHPAGLLRPGGQANVIVYTGDRPLLNKLARWRIRLAAWLSYVR
jgi:multidrug resistance efflux pump